MVVDPTDILDQLIATAESLSEHYIKVSRDFWNANPDEQEYNTLDAELRQEYEALARQIARVWGPAAFQGNWESDSFPVWYDALEMTYWLRGNHIAFVAYCHSDKELPFDCHVRRGNSRLH